MAVEEALKQLYNEAVGRDNFTATVLWVSNSLTTRFQSTFEAAANARVTHCEVPGEALATWIGGKYLALVVGHIFDRGYGHEVINEIATVDVPIAIGVVSSAEIVKPHLEFYSYFRAIILASGKESYPRMGVNGKRLRGYLEVSMRDKRMLPSQQPTINKLIGDGSPSHQR